MVSYKDFEALVIVLIFGVLGVICAMIIYELDARGILIDEFITSSITVTDLQAFVIIVWLIVGVLVAAIKS